MAREGVKNLIGEEIDENFQEPRQQAVEQAVKKTFTSGDMSLGNFWRNLKTEGSHILSSYQDEYGNEIPSYIAQTAPATTLSTFLTTALLAPFRIPAGGFRTKQQIEEAYRSAHKANLDKAKATLDSLKSQRDELQSQIYNAYQSYGTDIDTDIAATKDVQAMQDRLASLDDEISYVQEQIYSVAPTTTQVQDDAGFDFFADNPNANRSSTSRQDTKQPQDIPPIVEVDGIRQDTAPDLIPDTEEAPSASETMLRDLSLTQENALSNDEDNLVDDEPDEDLNEDFVSEQYNQAVPSGNTQDTSDDGSRSIGTFIFTPGIGSNARDYGFDVVSVPVRISSAPGNIFSVFQNRKARYSGPAIQIRTKRGKVIATFYPHHNNFTFAPDFQGKHSQRWEQKFERDFRANLMSYLVSGGFIDEDGNFKPDGNEGMRRRWKARRDNNGFDDFFNAFNSSELQQEDIDAPNVGTLSVSYTNGDGREVNTDLSVEIGTFGDNMPAQRMYYGRHLNIRDNQGRLIARYSPRTGTIKFTSNGDAQAMKKSVLDKLKRQAKSILSSAGFLDENGKLIPDGNEYYRTARKAANSIPSSIPTQTAQDTQGISSAATAGQQDTQQAPSVTPMGQQDTASQPTAQAQPEAQSQGKPKGKKANLADAIGNVSSRVDA